MRQPLAFPRLIFLLDLAVAWPPTWMDAFTGDGDRGARIRALREELGRERLVSFFATADELAQMVGVAVTNHLQVPAGWRIAVGRRGAGVDDSGAGGLVHGSG